MLRVSEYHFVNVSDSTLREAQLTFPRGRLQLTLIYRHSYDVEHGGVQNEYQNLYGDEAAVAFYHLLEHSTDYEPKTREYLLRTAVETGIAAFVATLKDRAQAAWNEVVKRGEEFD